MKSTPRIVTLVAATGLAFTSMAQAAGKADAPAAPASAAAPAAAAANLDAKTIDAAKKSVDRGLHYLRSQQAENGSYGNHVGLTATALLAFAESHRAYKDDDGPFIARASAWLLTQARADGAISGEATPAYNTALAILALHALDAKKYEKQIKAGQKFLYGEQDDEDKKYNPKDKFYGGIGYGGDERPDISNIQYALEALKKTDYDPNSDVWKKAETFLNRSQNRSESNDQDWVGNDGGFVYAPGQSTAGATTSYGAMSFAGLKSLVFCNVKKDDPRVQAVWTWIQKNYDFNQHPGMGTTTYYYYLQTAAAALEAFGEPFVPDEKGRKRNWAADLINRVTSIQQADGSWVNENPKYWEDNRTLITGRSVLALASALRSAGANK